MIFYNTLNVKPLNIRISINYFEINVREIIKISKSRFICDEPKEQFNCFIKIIVI